MEKAEMVAVLTKCPHCGVDHNPLLHKSMIKELQSSESEQDGNNPHMPGGWAQFNRNYDDTYLCDNCGQTYWVEGRSTD